MSPTALKNDSNPLANSRDSAVRATLQYKVTKNTPGRSQPVAQLKYEETGGAAGKFAEYKHNAWSLAAEHKATEAVTLVASYGQSTAGSCALVGSPAVHHQWTRGQDAQPRRRLLLLQAHLAVRFGVVHAATVQRRPTAT